MRAGMPSRIAALIIFVSAVSFGLGACARPAPLTNTVVRVERCPPAPPVVECPAFPVLGAPASIEDVIDAWIDARAAHEICTVAVKSWQKEWSSCE